MKLKFGESISLVVNQGYRLKLKKKLKAQYGDIDSESNGFILLMRKQQHVAVAMIPKQYFAEVMNTIRTFELDSLCE